MYLHHGLFEILHSFHIEQAWGPNESYQEVLDLGGRERVNVIPNEDYIVPATKENVKKALTFINSLSSYGGT